MLFLFRQLRRLELHKRSSRYFFYAIGEIVLVVMGILIALAINNWNEERILEIQRRKLIESLKADFSTNVRRLEEALDLMQKTHEDFLQFLKVAPGNNDQLSLDGIGRRCCNSWFDIRNPPRAG
jgi:hypothetical protein